MTRELNQSDSLDEWLDFIDRITIDEIELGLDRVRQAYKNLNIKQSFPIVMVGGTNGKGSTCAFLESIYHSANYKVASYSSPHFFKFNERVRINKVACSDKVIVNALFRVNEARKNIVVSHKMIIEESLVEQRAALFEEIEIGSIMEGRVKNITDFGVFKSIYGYSINLSF